MRHPIEDFISGAQSRIVGTLPASRRCRLEAGVTAPYHRHLGVIVAPSFKAAMPG
jgi:hypothetical protein